MPMTTMLLTGRASPASFLTCTTWSTISAEVMLRTRPSSPLAQKRHPMAHPTCVEMQSVLRRDPPISTVSTFWPSPSSNRNFMVGPWRDFVRSTGARALRRARPASSARNDRDRLVISSKDPAAFLYTQEAICPAR